MKIDLTDMTPEMTRELNRIAERYRKPYTEFVDRLATRFADAKFWWDTPLASRNIYICRNFLDICLLRLAVDIASQGQLTEWIVHDRGMQQALKDNIGARDIQVASDAQLGLKTKLKDWILGFSLAASEYAFYAFQRRIRNIQKWHGKKSLDAFRGRELTLISTYRVPAEVKDGVLQDRYFPGLKENSDEDIVFFAHPVFGNEAEGKQLLDMLHARDDHICIHDWIEPDDFREVREYIQWCRNVSVPQCTFDGMDVTALVKEAFRTGASDNNTMYGIVKGRVLCRLVEQYDLKLKCLIDWYEGQPSSNAMIRRFRKKFPDVPMVACSPFPYGENWLSLYPAAAQVKNKVVPEYFSVMGKAWEKQVRQFDTDLQCIAAPSFRHGKIFDANPKDSEKREGVLLVLSYMIDASKQLLAAFFEAIQGLAMETIGPIYIKNHPVNQGMRLSDYGIAKPLFREREIKFLTGDMDEALQGKATVVLSTTTSTLEVMLSGVYVINFIPAGDLSMVALPEEARPKVTVAYDAEDLRACLQSPKQGLSDREIEQLRGASFTRVNRETLADFWALRPI